MRIAEFQKVIDDTYGEKDRKRGLPATFLWFGEEVGELARALNGRTSRENLRLEFADTLAWLTTLASAAGIDLEEVARERYGNGCPRCLGRPCRCEEKRTPYVEDTTPRKGE
jgi:NTP pyrophosphatase (non-canonical NTP hydrolase)